MPTLPILLTRADGAVLASNPAAGGALGLGPGLSCDEVMRAMDDEGAPVCARGCAATFAPGEQRDHGVVGVAGRRGRLVCSDVGGVRVVTFMPQSDATVGGLSEREREVLVWVARGLTSNRIAARLGIAPATVRTHVEHIRAKLGVRTRSQAVARALALGLIE